jgi:hypothetical protein
VNGTARELFQSDCPLTACRWTSDPLPGADAAREARRKHLSEHPHGELVDHACAMRTEVTRYAKAEA